MKRLPLVAGALLLALCSVAPAEETDWRELFLEQQRSLVGCDNYACFMSWIQQFGSKRNIASFKTVDSRRITEIFQRERDLAKRELENPDAIEIEPEVKDDHVTIRIRSREKAGIPATDTIATRRLVLEDGIWKLGD